MHDTKSPDALLILCTCPDQTVAARLARTLVEERLAACVNRLPVSASTYRWLGEVVEETEVLLLIKTVRDRFDALAARLRELHPYDLPEIIAIPVADGLAGYLDWLREETHG